MTENKSDLISRDRLKKILSEEITRKFVRWDKTITVAEWETFTQDIIDNAPTVDTDEIYKKGYHAGFFATHGEPERPQGEWINQIALGDCKCSNCGKENLYHYANEHERWLKINTPFCAFCGADMEKGIHND